LVWHTVCVADHWYASAPSSGSRNAQWHSYPSTSYVTQSIWHCSFPKT